MFVAPALAQAGDPPVVDMQAETEVALDQPAEGNFPPFDSSSYPSQLLWLAVSFGLFYLFLKRVVLPRIGSILEVRRDRIAQDLDEAARMKEEADAAVAAYEQELADARKKASAIAQEARDEAKVEAEAERRRIENELEEKLAEAEAGIARIKSAALSDVGMIAEETAGTIVEQLVGGTVDRKAVSAAVKAMAQ
ncbi:F0F1 ATP synthase subunit B [Chelativorans sp. Marseille-P2723]|uniref:F0F1 ATP synthase subunit B n=1 Tax=Chelativorans sp. Marseille-P2723 TaxID=2709133 RepID=UPI00156F6557|nr:F0F1 ATP synthase subunit B [Chelativorans sp. Marseille-P2723]